MRQSSLSGETRAAKTQQHSMYRVMQLPELVASAHLPHLAGTEATIWMTSLS